MVFFFLVLFACAPRVLAGGVFGYDSYNTVVGFMQNHPVSEEETLIELARHFGLGFNELAGANPGVDPWIPVDGTGLVVPTAWVLPNAPREGIVVNVAEMRLYHYMTVNNKPSVRTYPIGIGIEGFDTPTGDYGITEKIESPTWYVPESIRKDSPELPAVVPPGDDNPLGLYAMRLSDTRYFLHGTNKPFGIGRRVSHGCIRLYPEDISVLYDSVEKGTPVNLIYQPIKIGLKQGVVYIEVHEDFLGSNSDPLGFAIKMLMRGRVLGMIEKERLRKAIEEKTGVPVPLTVPAPLID
jgi:L,D-transpeptidase ErfK/SrfK